VKVFSKPCVHPHDIQPIGGVGYDRGHIEEVAFGYCIEYGRA